MRRLILVLTALALFAAPAARADDITPLDLKYLVNFPLNLGRIAARPFSPKPEQFYTNLAIAGVTAGLIFGLDKPIRDFVRHDLHSKGLDSFFNDTFNKLGERPVQAGLLGGSYVLGEVLGDRELKQFGLLGIQGVVVSQLMVYGLKNLSNRERPGISGGDNKAFHGPGGKKGDSFPSGHASDTFAMAAILDSVYDDPWVSALGYALATGATLGRIELDRHWASDAFFGAVLGYAIGRIVAVTSPFQGEAKVGVLPMSVADGAGARLMLRY